MLVVAKVSVADKVVAEVVEVMKAESWREGSRRLRVAFEEQRMRLCRALR